jgi:hypothetical protein
MASEHQAWRDGYNAAAAGRGYGENPYPKGSPLWRAWDDGWLDAPPCDEGEQGP